jgi:positive regulator of sigma E activity
MTWMEKCRGQMLSEMKKCVLFSRLIGNVLDWILYSGFNRKIMMKVEGNPVDLV